MLQLHYTEDGTIVDKPLLLYVMKTIQFLSIEFDI